MKDTILRYKTAFSHKACLNYKTLSIPRSLGYTIVDNGVKRRKEQYCYTTNWREVSQAKGEFD